MKIKITLVLALLMLSGFNVFSQAKKRDTLEWFVGHWVSKTVFKADSNYVTGGSVGSTITVNSSGSVAVQSQDIQQFNQQIDKGASSTNNMESQLKQELLPEGFNEYNLYTYSKQAMDTAQAFFTSLKISTTPSSSNSSSNPTANFSKAAAQQCQAEQGTYNSIIQFWQANRHSKSYTYTPPPQADYFNCWGCNRPGQKTFEQQCKGYDTTFFEPESGMVKKALGMMKQMTLLGQDGDPGTSSDQNLQEAINSLFHKSKSNPAGNGACAFLSYSDLSSAVAFLAVRMENKADQLFSDMKKAQNYNSYIPTIRVELAAFRQAELLLGSTGQSNGSENQLLEKCGGLVSDLLNKIMDQAVTQHDLTYLADIPLMFELEREMELLGVGSSGEDAFLKKMDGLMHYTLSLEMNIKVDMKNQQSQVTEAAHLKGSAEMVLELDTINCVRLVLSKTESGVLTANVLENTATYPKCSPTYQGTMTYTMPSPQLTLHFCKQGAADSLTLGGFSPKPATAGTWNQPCGGPPENLGINGLDGFFNDPNAIVQRAQGIKANAGPDKQALENMEAQAKQQAAQIMAQMNSGGGMTSVAGGAGIKSLMDMNDNTLMSSVINMGKLIFPVTIKNNATMIDQTLNAKQNNTLSQMNQMIEYGTLQIHLKQKTQ